jgi:hypothetical protein
MKDISAIIDKILLASHYSEVFARFSFKKQYLEYLKQLHPDICPHPQATEAVSKINFLKKEIEKLNDLKDDAGEMSVLNENEMMWQGSSMLLEKSYENYQKLMRLTDKASLHFQKYLPQELYWKGKSLQLKHSEAIVPLSGLRLPEEHVTWVLSRLFEFSAWLNQIGLCHAGLNPESVAIVPKTHGIVILSFYHLSSLSRPLTTISKKYQNWYPHTVFSDKKAVPEVDLSLSQSLGIYLLGDTSGNGVKLKKTHSPELIDFLLQMHYQPYETFDNYRKLLLKLYGKPTFHHLEL